MKPRIVSLRSAVVDLMDLYGKTLEHWNSGTSKSGTRNLELDLSAYPAGVYFLRIRNGNEIIVRKIIKL
jgi:hypothetical protein